MTLLGECETATRGMLQRLLERGELATSPLPLLEREVERHLGASRWPGDLVRGLHLASEYPSVRYAAWMALHSRPSVSRWEELLELSFACERLLWRGLAAAPASSGSVWFSLALEDPRPAAAVREGRSPDSAWLTAVRGASLSAAGDTYSVHDVCGVRFVSVYLGWLEGGALDDATPAPSDDAEIDRLCDALSRSPALHDDVLWVVRRRLRASWMPRGPRGAPVGTDAVGPLLRLRARCELALLTPPEVDFPFPMDPSDAQRPVAAHLRDDGYAATAELVTRLTAHGWWSHVACCASHGDLWIAAIGASRAALVVRHVGSRESGLFEVVRAPQLEGTQARLDDAVELVAAAVAELGLASRTE